MTDQTSTPVPDATPSEDVVVEPSRLRRLALNHPRTARVLATGVVAVAIVGTALVANTVRKNKAHLNAAGEHLSEAATEISNAVSPSPETDA